MERISWDEYFMSMAELASRRSTCIRRQVGAVIVKDHQLLATGYNGAPKGLPNCCDLNSCLRQELGIPSGERHELCRAVHAENNAITQCAVNGVSCKGGTLYVTDSPCNMCLKQIINAGIVRIVAGKMYPDKLSEELLRDSGILFEVYNKDA
ncbi:MAG: cytidine/deoxycytidylate deaminase family protein [Firmicutes bacterium]|nr:cytidine/deoxycytidylate deaminase family protein [Bacillota bacterium]